ncbi:Ribosomal large subunit biogenesis-related protein [Oopsacas minuta]|uniref:Nucleolar protein 16 n=1 Tax=Oopsacas minuta TaxID=111878 RepID=A0AAV7JKV4_9METZ|nr:Ribosomal large subunit biogenesis-related protein [Oopsacas minuta]
MSKNRNRKIVISKKRRQKKRRANDNVIRKHWRVGLSVKRNYERMGVSADANRLKKDVKNVPSEVVKELELTSKQATDRQESVQVVYFDWHTKQLLNQLIDKYGDDYHKMARDSKLNIWQKTAGQIRRQCIRLSKAQN